MLTAERQVDSTQIFEQKPVVQFTATPFREDGKHLQGRTIYSFPLREAQPQGYFSNIDYTAVIDFGDIDQAVARQAVDKLRADLALDLDHVLMARVRSVDRAKEVLPLYEGLAPDLKPVIINSRIPKRQPAARGVGGPPRPILAHHRLRQHAGGGLRPPGAQDRRGP